MPKPSEDLLTIHVTVDLTPATLSAIVANFKAIFGKDKTTRSQIDTADLTSEMISRFLLDKDFESYVKDQANYAFKENPKKER